MIETPNYVFELGEKHERERIVKLIKSQKYLSKKKLLEMIGRE